MDATFSHIKAVFCDIDGTLLTSQHTVSPRTVAAIRALRERGVLFGLCTGRDAHATEAMYELWGIEGLVDVLVGCGGAEVIDRAHDINELSYPLPGETIARICKHMADLPATPVCPRDGVFYVPESNACVEHLSRVDGVPYQVVDFAEFLREPQPKVMFTTAPEEERAGLGFAVMESLMDRVKVVSHPGKGTTVTLEKRIVSKAGEGDAHR